MDGGAHGEGRSARCPLETLRMVMVIINPNMGMSENVGYIPNEIAI